MTEPIRAPSIVAPRPPGAWTAAKARIFEEQFHRFLENVYVTSKDKGAGMNLGANLFDSQRRFLKGVFSGLENDVRRIYVLKGRQQGISTICRALTLFWMGMHKGLRGYCVLDTEQHKEEARLELLGMARNLPPSMNFPAFVKENRYVVALDNDSLANFGSAGVKKSQSSGTLGRSTGINYAHLSELCSWADEEGMESFENALSESYENRLYVYESTGRGHNLWFDIWQKGIADPNHTQCIFIGWYFKETQTMAESDPDFARYGLPEPNSKERETLAEVERRYGYRISRNQLAWYRRKMDPLAVSDGEAATDWSGTPLRMQEQPNTEDEAFQSSGAKFFDGRRISQLRVETARQKYETWRFEAGVEFTDCRIVRAGVAKQVELRVWEEPVRGGCYVVGADPAYGTDMRNDRSSIQVLRCYADGMEQVAEYAWPGIQSKQFGWVILAVASWYAAVASNVYMIVEINNGGKAVWDEIQEVKRLVSSGYLTIPPSEQGLASMLSNIRNFIRQRADSFSPQNALQWKTTPGEKIRLMERLRDFHNNGKLLIRSPFLLDEMQKIVREGATIAAAGSGKDDRVMAMAFATHAWEQRARRILVPQNRTKQAEIALQTGNVADSVFLFHKYQVESLIGQRRARRDAERIRLLRGSWRSGGAR